MFASSIKDNIAYGKEGAMVEEIRVAAELANAAKFIDKLPQILVSSLFLLFQSYFLFVILQLDK